MTPTLLQGIRVIDLSRVMSGPYCTALLADLGAEVIKVETPDSGDDSRHFGPYRDGESVYFSLLNRNKRSITLNLKEPRARGILHELVRTADVVVENFRPGVATRLGVDHETLRALNPALVYLSISGFGQQGDFRGRPAYDLIIQAMSGLMSVTGRPDGEPTCVGESVADLVTGLFGSWAVLAALLARERDHGEGRYIDLAMFDALLALQITSASRLFATGEAPQRVGNRHPVTVPVDCFQAADGWVVIVVSSTVLFQRFAHAAGRPDWLEDPRFADNASRARHERVLRAEITHWTLQREVDEVVQACLAADVPAGPVWDLQQACEQARAQGRPVLRHDVAGSPWPCVLQPALFSGGASGVPVTPHPALGQHTDEVLAALGLSATERAVLREQKVT